MRTIISLLLIAPLFLAAQNAEKPKLIVGIVVDQMRYDFLYRYSDRYGNNGFKKLLARGYSCENTHIPYVPTITAPGHTCVYTGSVPALHGIVSNEWYSRQQKTEIYCVADTHYRTIGAESKTGQCSPNNLKVTTITDELRLASNFRSKTIGVALKDRSSILPAGHIANHAYWYDGKSGHFVSSSYYQEPFPEWVKQFNDQHLPEKYLKSNWKTISTTYAESTDDDEPWEGKFANEEKPVFPHKVDELTKKGYSILTSTPWGNTLTFEMAKAAIANEHLGKGPFTDFLAVSFSSTDHIGHQFGPNSIETEDCYLRLDSEMGNFLLYLDQAVGAGNYLLFLTADHGVSHAVGFSQYHQVPAGHINTSLDSLCNQFLEARFGEKNMVESFSNFQVYLNESKLNADGMRRKVTDALIPFLLQQPGIAKAVELAQLGNAPMEPQLKERIANGYNQQLSGDIQVVYDAAFLEGYPTGTTHSGPYNYDTHIPLVWYGWHIKPGKDFSETRMTDIAATLAALLHIQEPSGCVGRPIAGIFK
ncbi:MAG: alkaline phosphatase PafA [Chitinophagales bacterium]